MAIQPIQGTNRFTVMTARRQRSFIKLLLSGPKYTGKTRGALSIALGLADTGKPEDVIVIDSEKHDGVNPASALFDEMFKHMYSIMALPDHRPMTFLEALRYAVSLKPKVIIVESLTDMWHGANDEVAWMAAQSDNPWDTHSPRRHITPIIEEFFNEVRTAPCHIICTARMKAKTQRIRGTNNRTTIVDVGDQIDFKARVDREFLMSAHLSAEHRLSVTFSKVAQFANAQIDLKDHQMRRGFVASLRSWATLETPSANGGVAAAATNPDPAATPAEPEFVRQPFSVDEVFSRVRLQKRGNGKLPIRAKAHCQNAINRLMNDERITPHSTTEEVVKLLLDGIYDGSGTE